MIITVRFHSSHPVKINLRSYLAIYDKQTGYSSPIYAKSVETGEARYFNTEWSAAYLVELGVPREKILIGLEGLGHTFQLMNSTIHDFAAPVVGTGYGGGWMTFVEFCLLIKSAGSHWDDEAKVNYTYYKDQWTNVGDVRAAAEKALFVKANGYGGAFTFVSPKEILDCWNMFVYVGPSS